MFSTCSDAMKRWCKALFVVTAVVLLPLASAEAYDFPLFENFEQAGSVFEVKDDCGWGVVGSHGDWVHFAGVRHLDNNIHEESQQRESDAPGDYRAVFSDFITIPSDASNPVLFFWYKSKLYKFGDRIYVDIHVKNGDTVDVDTKLILTRWDNTREYYKWKKVSLSEYKGKEIKVAFRQSMSRWGRSRLFVVDNLALCNADTTDEDEDGIPDNLDYSPNGELLPPVENFLATNSGELQMELSWAPLDRQVHPVAGYKIYRRTEGSTCDVLLNYHELLSPETESFSDDGLRNATNYTYKIVAISSDGQRGVTAESNAAYVNYNLTPFPFEESFDSVTPSFVIPEDSGWAISEAHGEWGNFSGNYHLDSNPTEAEQVLEWGSRHIVRASMKHRVHIPEDAENPTLSYWYKMDLRTLETEDLGYDDFWNYNDDFNFLTGLLYGDRIYIDIHFVLYRFWGDPIEMVHRYVRTYTPEDNTTDYIWDSIPLHHYRGTEIWVDFRKKTGCSGVGSAFVMDDFRISDEPDVDDDYNGIPDAFETPLGADKLPYVRDFKTELTEIGSVKLSWTPVAGNPSLDPAGYQIYRQVEGEEGFQQLTETPLPYDATQWIDTSMTTDGTYRYYVVGATTDGVEGYPTQVHSVDVVIPGPVITAQPQSTEAEEGSQASFAIDAKGLHLTYQWKRNGEDIPGASSASYTLPLVTLADHGAEFSCTVTNVAGSVTSDTAVLTAHLAPPVIGQQPLAQSVMERSSVTFKVIATGSHLTYQWQKDGIAIPGAAAPTYTLDPVPYAGYDGSSYRCTISNTWNGENHVVNSQEAILDVVLAPPVITTQPHSRLVTEHESATFSVAAMGTGLRYQWMRDGIEIPGADGTSYTIGSTDLQDHGARFSCRIDNALNAGTTIEGGLVTTQSVLLSVALASPAITTQPAPKTITERGSVTFTTIATGSHLAYQWQKNGSDISGATQSTLTLNPVSYGDDGAVFRCVVSNAWNGQTHSVTSAEAALDVVLAAPVITLDTPTTVTLEEGKSLNLLVETIGTFVTYQWFKNGAPVDGATNALLNIDTVALDDHEATYHCVVANTREINGKPEGGITQSVSTTLTVNLAPPVITTQPVAQSVTERGSVTFTTIATGSHLAYQWQKNGAAIEGATQNTLTLDPVLYDEDGAVFRCIVSNAWNGQDHSVISSEAALDVILAPPVITLDTPVSVTLEEGKPLNLLVETIGTFVTYQWSKNGAAIDGATGAALQVDAVTLDDFEAQYHCVASNRQEINGVVEGGEVESTVTSLAVNLAPPEIKTHPVNKKIKERSPVSFSIEAEGSNLTYAWFKKKNEVSEAITDGVTVNAENTQSTLDIVKADYQDDGALIYCVVSNAWNGQNHDVKSFESTLDVELAEPVLDTDTPADITVDEGKTMELEVAATGTFVTYQWYVGTAAIDGATSAKLTISPIELTDNGKVYQCVISNSQEIGGVMEGGEVKSTATTLAVNLAPPEIKAQPVSQKIKERSPASFTIEAEGSNLTYAWFKKKNEVSEAITDGVTVNAENTSSTLDIAKADYQDDGALIYCVVSNAWNGQSHDIKSFEATLDVALAEPVLDTDTPADITVDEGRTLELRVAATGTFVTYQWYVGTTAIDGATTAKLTISPIELTDNGKVYQCIVSNSQEISGVMEGGEVKSTATTLAVNLAPPEIKTQPVSQKIKERSPGLFTIEAEGSNLTYAWFKKKNDVAEAITDGVTVNAENTQSTLDIAKADYQDDGATIYCVVSNAWNGQSHDVKSFEATLDVELAKPVIDTDTPADITVDEGKTLELQVAATGTFVSYQWYVGTAAIDGATSAKLTISPVELADNGKVYQCVISNSQEIGGVMEGGEVKSTATTLAVNLAPPEIKTHPVNTKAKERTPVSFTIEASGSNLTYAWFKKKNDVAEVITDGITVNAESTQSTLDIAKADYNDDGALIYCVVSNAWNGQSHDVKSFEATLDVELAEPVLDTDTPADITVDEGKTLELRVAATGTFVTYQWYVGTAAIDGATFDKLTISPIELTDNGKVYQCVISNRQEIGGMMEGGEVKSTATILAVNLAPPEIKTQPVNTKAKERTPVSFTIEAEGSNLTYAWFKKKNDVAEAITDGVTVNAENTQSTLDIAKADYQDDGALIYCVVSNAWNGQSHDVKSFEATLDVELAEPILDTDTPAGITVDEGKAMELQVAATGTFVTYQWYVGTTAIGGATSAKLTISPIELTDNGKVYQCVISNRQEIGGVMEGGEVKSTATTLAVNLAPPEIKTQPVSQKIKERSPASFTIEAEGSNLTYAWFKKKNEVAEAVTKGVSVNAENTSATLDIAKADYQDDGILIYCVVSNAWNGQNHEIKSSEATLDVELAEPVIEVQPGDQNVDELQSASFSVNAIGTNLKYQWYRGTSSLAGETGNVLNIASVSYDDNGALFSCVISNTMGEEGGSVTTREAKLIVRRIVPVITKQPEGKDLNEGEKLSLSVSALGADLVYQWKKGGQPIAGATSPHFSIDSVVYADRGNYVCVVSNSLYEVVSDVAEVTVIKPAEPELSINVPDNMETTDSFVGLSGFASSPDVTIVKVEATNDRFPGQVFGLILHEDGSLTGEVPLAIGENHLTITMILAEGDPITKSVTVTSTLSAVPVITITSPADGTTVTEETVTLSGQVRSSLSPEKIRLLFNGEVYFPTGDGGDYTFSIAPVQLVEGPNTLTLVAETPYGNSSQQVVVTYDAGTGIVEENPPEITIHAPASGAWLSNRDFSVTGVVHGSAEITSVFVNDTPATVTGAGTDVSFEHAMAFAEGAGNDQSITVVATDSTGLSSQVEFLVHYDGGPPQIHITSPELATSQALYTVKATPFHLTGTIDEGNLSSITLNGAPVTALPQGESLWAFDVAIPLVRLEDRDFLLEVTDLAGYRSFYGFRMLFDAEIAIAILSPEEGSTLTVSGLEMSLEVKASTPGLGAEEQVLVRVDGGEDVSMDRSGSIASKSLVVPSTQGTRSLTVKALTSEGTLISQQSATFEVVNLDNTPVRVVRQEPENGRDDVEPNTFIAFYFNKPVEPSKITLEILEIAHGPTWVAPAKGADLTSMSKVEPEQVHRERDPVPGGLSSFPENTMMAFYPERDLAYGGTVYCRVLHDGEEVHRGTFSVRPMPTLVEGFVADQFMQPVKGMEVLLKERKLKTVTNADGYYSFGFGLPASENIRGGLTTVSVNPGMKNLAMGTHEVLMGLTEGRLNRVEMIRIPALDTTEPFSHIASGAGPSDLKGGDLTLDFTDAGLVFPDGAEEGNVHVQFTVREQIPDPTLDLAVPHWMYAIQPRGIIAQGKTAVSLAMPELSGSHDYLAEMGQRVLLLGFDPVSKTIVPAGVGSINHNTRHVVSEGPCTLKSLDYIGYCPVPVELQSHLDQVVSGDVSMAELIGVIESLK